MKTYYPNKEQCVSAIESISLKNNGLYLQEGVFRIGGFLYSAEQEYNRELGQYGEWFIKKEEEKYPYTLHFEKSFLTVGELKKFIEDEEVPDDTIISFEKDDGTITLANGSCSYDYLICNETSQPLPTDGMGELESRRYREQMVLKIS